MGSCWLETRISSAENGVAHLAARAAEADTQYDAKEQQHQGIGIGSPPDVAQQPQFLCRRLACLLPMGQEKFRHLLGIHLLIAPPEALKPPNIDCNRRNHQSPANVPDALKKRQQFHAAVFPETDARQRQQHRNPQCSSIGKQIPRKAHPVRPGGLRLLHPVRQLFRLAQLQCKENGHQLRKNQSHHHPVVPGVHFADFPSAGQRHRQKNPGKHGNQADNQGDNQFLFHHVLPFLWFFF